MAVYAITWMRTISYCFTIFTCGLQLLWFIQQSFFSLILWKLIFLHQKKGHGHKNQLVICSVHIFFVFSLFHHLFLYTLSLFSPGNILINSSDSNIYRSFNFTWSLSTFPFFFSGTAGISSEFFNFLTFLQGIKKHQTHYRFLRWTNFLVLKLKFLSFPELSLFLICPIIILQVNLSRSIWSIVQINTEHRTDLFLLWLIY